MAPLDTKTSAPAPRNAGVLLGVIFGVHAGLLTEILTDVSVEREERTILHRLADAA